MSTLGYRSLSDILQGIQHQTGFRFDGDASLLRAIHVPEMSLVYQLPAAIHSACQQLRRTVVVAGPAETPGWQVLLAKVNADDPAVGSDPAISPDHCYCDIRFFALADQPQDEEERLAKGFLHFNSQPVAAIPEEGSLLLRISRDDYRAQIGFPLPSSQAERSDEITRSLLHCGLEPRHWHLLSPVGRGAPTDLVLDFHYKKLGNHVFLTGSGPAHLLRGDSVQWLCRRVGLMLDPKALPVGFAYSPWLNRTLLEECGLLNPGQASIGDLPIPDDYPPPESDVLQPGGTRRVIDLLGAYFPDVRQATLFPRMIAACACSLGVPTEDIERIVEIHELAHAISHVGRDLDGDIWSDYYPRGDEQDQVLHESIAQWLTVKTIEGAPRLVNAFTELEKRQPHPYRAWQTMRSFPNEQFRRWVMDHRQP